MQQYREGNRYVALNIFALLFARFKYFLYFGLHCGDFILNFYVTLRKAVFSFILRSLFCFRFTQFFIGLRTDRANWRKVGVRLVYRRRQCS